MKKVLLGSLVLLFLLSSGCNTPDLNEIIYNYDGKFDYAGQTYYYVNIGPQSWMTDNLNFGRMVFSLTGVDSLRNNGILEKYCYKNDTLNCHYYGALYQWNEIMNYTHDELNRGICPPGWRIPSESDFETLIRNVDNDGNALKAKYQGEGDGKGNNRSKFAALLHGIRGADGAFYYDENITSFWSSTGPENNNIAASLRLYSNSGQVNLMYFDKREGHAVRCIKF